MGYLREKYGEPEQIDSKWIKFVRDGQTYKGTIDGFEEGKYGTDVIFTDGKRVTLNNTILLREVVKHDPEKGDVLEIVYLGREPLRDDSTREPAKLYRVTKNGGSAAPAAPASSSDGDDSNDEPF